MARSVLHNAAFTMAGQLSARLLALVFYAALARVIGPERYGDQSFGVAVGTLCAMLLEPGLNTLLVRDGARDPETLRRRLAEALGFKLVSFLVVLPGMVGLCALLGYRGPALSAVRLAGGTGLLVTFEDLAASALSAVERLDLEGTLRLLSKVCWTGLGFLAIAISGSFEAILAAVFAGAALTAVIGLVLVRRAGIPLGLSFRPKALAAEIAQIWPLALSAAMWMVILRVDQFMASQLGVSHEELGNYGAAVKVLEALVLFPNAVNIAFQARVSRSWTESPEACSRQLRIALFASLAVTIPVAVGGMALSQGLSAFIFGAEFTGTPLLLTIQLACLPLIAVMFLSNHALVCASGIRAHAAAVGANLVVNVLANLALVPRYGVAGASVSAVLGNATACLIYMVALKRRSLRPGLLHALWRPALAVGAMALALWGLSRYSLPLFASIAVGGAVYAMVFFGLGGWVAVKALREARAAGPSAPVPSGG